ncbi:uncharacterized protein EV154DRAFT_415340 [Mucor mucedo]|uniref:uncharacterized protein n=1 Tax=Mucor mucedo TaxID=29922 RepID=UPI00221F9267|nr:uncharacterized protein EV154DRAFT_415340 [Mucor mucedo]KAI7894254.1 hypothetical protein EV154DRAFT_415340 [Mucor mucedo]
MVHDLTTAYNNGVDKEFDSFKFVNPVTRLLEYLGAHVLIQLKQNEDSYFYRSVQTVSGVQGITTINLPPAQVEHSLWISDLPIEALKHWNTMKMELVVITDRRPVSLTRLLESTNGAFYLGDETVELVIHLEQSSDNVTRGLVQDFMWQHGEKKVRHRIRKGGLMPAIVESWYPSDNDHYGVLLEDDIELSPLFYAWTKYNILKYRYSPKEKEAHQHIYGVSLYSPRNLELLPEGRRPFGPEKVLEEGGYARRSPYATPVPCSWGAVYFPEHWREFHTYLTERIAKEEWPGYHNVTVPNSRSTRWKKSWKKYFIELVYLRGYVMVYPNFEGFQSFSTNHLEYGTHVKGNGRTQSKVMEFLVPLMQQDLILEQLPDHHLPMFRQLPILDLWGRMSTMGDLDQVGADWHEKVSVCPRTVGTFDPSDLLCPFEENVLKSKSKSTIKS